MQSVRQSGAVTALTNCQHPADNAVAEAEDRRQGVVERVAMLTSLALTERESEFCRAECAHVGNAVEVSLGSRGIRTAEINIQHPWCRIGYAEARAVHHAFTAVSHAFTRFGVAPAVDPDDLPSEVRCWASRRQAIWPHLCPSTRARDTYATLRTVRSRSMPSS